MVQGLPAGRQGIAHDLEGEDRARFENYETARSLQPELREAADRGQSAEGLARQYGALGEFLLGQFE